MGNSIIEHVSCGGCTNAKRVVRKEKASEHDEVEKRGH